MATSASLKPVQPEPLDAFEQEYRREMLRRSEHENYLEGCPPTPEYDHIREAWIRGEIDATGAISIANVQDGILPWDEVKRRLANGEKVPGYS